MLLLIGVNSTVKFLTCRPWLASYTSPMTTHPRNNGNGESWQPRSDISDIDSAPASEDLALYHEQAAGLAQEATGTDDHPTAAQRYERLRLASLQAEEHEAYIGLTLRLAALMRKLGDSKMTTAYLAEAVLYNEITGRPIDAATLREAQTEEET